MIKISRVVESFLVKKASLRKSAFFDENTWRKLVGPEHKDEVEDVLDKVLDQERTLEPLARKASEKILMGPLAEVVHEHIGNDKPFYGTSVPGSKEAIQELESQSTEAHSTIQKMVDTLAWKDKYQDLAGSLADMYVANVFKDKMNHILAPVTRLVSTEANFRPVVELDQVHGGLSFTNAWDAWGDDEKLKKLYFQLTAKQYKEASSPLRGTKDYDGSGLHPAAKK